MFGSLNLTTVKLSEVGSSFLKHTDAESKGIKAHFNMDDSGVLLLDRVSHSALGETRLSPYFSYWCYFRGVAFCLAKPT